MKRRISNVRSIIFYFSPLQHYKDSSSSSLSSATTGSGGAASTSAAMVAACGPYHGYEERRIDCEGPLNAERQKSSSLMARGKCIIIKKFSR